jgi:hypothetical protein
MESFGWPRERYLRTLRTLSNTISIFLSTLVPGTGTSRKGAQRELQYTFCKIMMPLLLVLGAESSPLDMVTTPYTMSSQSAIILKTLFLVKITSY